MDIKPTGLKIKTTGIEIHRFEDGKIAEGWTNWDRYGLMEQIGAI